MHILALDQVLFIVLTFFLIHLKKCTLWVTTQHWLLLRNTKTIYLGPVVQSIVRLTSLLVVKMLTVLVSRVSNSQLFFAEKMRVAFPNAEATHIFLAKILAYMHYLMIKVLMIC